MAKIEITDSSDGDSLPASVETIEVRPWGVAGKSRQSFDIGSGANFSADGNIWLEIQYAVQGVHVFYTRNFLHCMRDTCDTPGRLERLDRFAADEQLDSFGFGDMLPATSLVLKRSRYEWDGQTHSSYALEISADMGVVFGRTSPGDRMLTITLKYIPLEWGVQFMRDLILEIDCAFQGRRPDPAGLSPGASEWSFARQLNRQAYDLIAQNYQEDYYSNPQLSSLFEAWLDGLPRGGHILDAGCGHGDPVVARLLERGFQVTGIDLSPGMLQRAREQFPGVEFFDLAVTDLEEEAVFDGACSLSSVLYLDPIDLSHGFYRLHRALKPGGALLLYAYDQHPDWRGLPYSREIHQWMWSWTYSLEEAVQALEEHGYFKVIRAENVTTEEQKERMAELWRKSELESWERFNREMMPGLPLLPPPDLTHLPAQLAYCYAIVAQRVG